MDTGAEEKKGPTKRTVKASREVRAAFEHSMAMRAGLEIAQRAAGASIQMAVMLAAKEYDVPTDAQVSYDSRTEEVFWMESPE